MKNGFFLFVLHIILPEFMKLKPGGLQFSISKVEKPRKSPNRIITRVFFLRNKKKNFFFSLLSLFARLKQSLFISSSATKVYFQRGQVFLSILFFFFYSGSSTLRPGQVIFFFEFGFYSASVDIYGFLRESLYADNPVRIMLCDKTKQCGRQSWYVWSLLKIFFFLRWGVKYVFFLSGNRSGVPGKREKINKTNF